METNMTIWEYIISQKRTEDVLQWHREQNTLWRWNHDSE